MKILITGGTGAIGRRLCPVLSAKGHALTVLSRQPERVAALCGAEVSAIASLEALKSSPAFDAVVNLAGEVVIGPRWTPARKKILWDSRVTLTEHLLQAMGGLDALPKIWINASATGVYGDGGMQALDESSPGGGGGFGRELCLAWEQAAVKATALGARLCILRIAPVLMPDAGMLKSMLPSFRLGLGARLGDGGQWMPWVHHADLLAMLEFLLEREDLSGVFNAAAPQAVTNREFTAALAKQVHRPAFLSVPAPLLRLAMGEMAELLLCGQKAAPKRLLEAGFNFRYPELAPALAEVCPIL
jgi:uncharacterized protein (TIGR01777 family)